MKPSAASAALACFLSSSMTPTRAQNLPVVDLDTSQHQAVENATGNYYTFKNIPYAEPPVGVLRFNHPEPRVTINRTIDDGSNGRICPQAPAPWFQDSIPLVSETIATTCNNTSGAPPGAPPAVDLPVSEDCLLLDVALPGSVWETRESAKRPVLVWIHGGGYIEGSKESAVVPELLAKSIASDKGGMIVVSINYRLGLFGFPPRQPEMEDVASNAALHDQQLALEWVRDNIDRFGGDNSQVTVIGESAGAGGIMAHLSAFGGVEGASPFQRAIIQSPAMKPAVTADRYSQLYDQFLNTANITGYLDARALSSEQLQTINIALVGQAAFADTIFGPNVDGSLIPDQPVRLMAEKRVDSAVQVLVAHNSDEGLPFTDPQVSDEAGFKAFIQNLIPNLPSETVNAIADEIYPPDFSGTQSYISMTERLKLAVSEALFDCNAIAISLAYGNNTRGYLFDICPGIHAQDVSYTFFNGQSEDSLGLLVDGPTADTMQSWFVDFTILGDASPSSVTQLPVFGPEASVARIDGTTTLDVAQDPAANARCQFWIDGF